jgi:hypothetical protein
MKRLFAALVSALLGVLFACAAFGADAGKLKISILTDDAAISDKYVAEHGLSILIELPN